MTRRLGRFALRGSLFISLGAMMAIPIDAAPPTGEASLNKPMTTRLDERRVR